MLGDFLLKLLGAHVEGRLQGRRGVVRIEDVVGVGCGGEDGAGDAGGVEAVAEVGGQGVVLWLAGRRDGPGGGVGDGG